MSHKPSTESKTRILIVEDELIIAKGIEKRIKALGYSVTDTVSSGEEAVEQALQTLPDLVLMDINLHGGMDGVTAAEQIRSQVDIPIIFLTAYADSDTLARAKVSDPFGYIIKPFQDITLKSTIEMGLYKHLMESRLRRSEKILAIKNQIANVFLTIPDEEMYGEVLEIVKPALDSSYGIFGIITDTGDLIIPSLSREVWEECRVHDKSITFPRERWGGLWGRALVEKKTLFSNEGFSVPEGHLAVDSFLAVPILYRGDVIGLLSVANKERGYTEKDRELLEAIVDRIAPILQARLLGERQEQERRRTEEALQKSERLLRSVFDAIPDLFSIIDKDHRIVLSNWHGGLDYVPDSIRAAHPCCYEAYYGRDAVCEPCHTIEVFATGKPVFREKFNPRVGYVEIRSYPIFDEAGNVTLVAEHVHDITARKMTQEALAGETERLLVTLRSIGDGVVTTDTSGNIVLLNKVAEALTGWSQTEAAGKHLDEVLIIINEKTRQRIENPVGRVLTTGCFGELAKHTALVSRDGKERIIADSAAPIRDKESRIVGAVLVFRDITEKRKMEEELLKAQKLESIGILAGGIAHDFNNLLTAILGNISLSKMYVSVGDKIHQKLCDAEKASLRARDLTQQLLTFSRGGAPVKKISSIAEIIRDSTAFSLSGSKVTCTFTIPDDLWLVEVDEGQISQVINNIILNAEQAMPAGGVIEVACRNVQVGADDNLPFQDGRYILVTISDQGEGIPEEALPRIFDPYFTTKDLGKGLGLSTVYSIVQNHNGHISVSSKPGVGTTFFVYLPATNSPEYISSTEEITANLVEAQTVKGKVLVMDDEENIREVVAEMLRFIGYDVTLSRNGEEAVSLYTQALESNEPFAAVLMGLTIPGGMGGGEVIRILREIDPEVKGIVSSGYSNDPIMSDYKRFGFQGIIMKPYKLGQIRDVLERVLEG
ncbi:MAG: response regulator [Geobacter sp.]|nr:MAG: response regulator [Geobacter sp.]